jgi:RHS repeat-associated protein
MRTATCSRTRAPTAARSTSSTTVNTASPGIRDAEGGTWKRDYDAQGRLVEETDPRGNKTEYAYDKVGRPVEVLDAKGGVTKLAYTPDGRLASYTDCSGHGGQWEYDDRKRLIKRIDATGNVTRYRYTPLSAETLAQAYNESADRGNHPGLLEAVIHPDGSQEQLRHDAEGRLLAYTDALQRTTAYRYTATGLIAQRTDALGHSLQYRWDALGRLSALENENGSVYRFQYDPVGRLLREQGFDGKATEYRYDEASGVLAETVEVGVTTRLDFDTMGRLVQRRAVASGLPEQTETFAYNANGQLAEAKNEHARLQWFYDAAGNLVREHQHYHGPFHPDKGTAVWHHHCDELNQRTGTTRPDGHRLEWLTYGAGHVHGLLLDGQELVSFERDALYQETGRTQANGLSQRLRYDGAGRRLEQHIARTAGHTATNPADALSLQRTYTYDKTGQLVGIGDSRHGNTSYRYDPVGQLVEASSRFGRELFAFDPAGNIAGDAPALFDAPATVSPLLDNLLKAYAGVRYRYNAHGNLVARTRDGRTTTFTWDGFDRMTAAIEEDGTTTAFRYDPLGRRIGKRSRDAVTVFGWDGDTLAFESTQSTAGEREDEGLGASVHYIHEPGSFAPLVQVRRAQAIVLGRTPDVRALMAANGGAYDIAQDPLWNGELQPRPRAFAREQLAFYQCDHLGTPHELTDHEGRVAWSAQYKAWGEAREAISQAGRRAGLANPIRFQGQYFDAETGLHYNRHRYYDPACGRYVSRDPLGLAGGRNLHVYAGNNPVRGIDPLGLADINLFPTSETIRTSAENIPRPQGAFMVGGHGNQNVMVDGSHNPISPQQMAARIKAHPSYTEGQHVVLLSCNTGNGTDPYAKKLATELNAPVSGPDKFLWIWPNGATKPAGMKPDGTMDTADIGQWNTFHP